MGVKEVLTALLNQRRKEYVNFYKHVTSVKKIYVITWNGPFIWD